MENFPDGMLLRLRSRARGAYLHADADGFGVSLRAHRASMSTAWEVLRVRRDGDDSGYGARFLLLLRSAATGRYLALSPRGGRRRRAIQRTDGEEGHGSLRWKAFRAENGVSLWNACYNRNLRAGAWNRFGYNGNGVTAGFRRGGAAAQWLVEAALPLNPAPVEQEDALGLPKQVPVWVPRLRPDSSSNGVSLPVVSMGERNIFIGYITAGLVDVVEGTGGDVLRAQERLLKLELGAGQLPHGLTALAFLAGRGSGIRMLPLLVMADDADGSGESDGARDGGGGAEVEQGGDLAGAEERHGDVADVFQDGAAGADMALLDAGEHDAGAAGQDVADADAGEHDEAEHQGGNRPEDAAAAAGLDIANADEDQGCDRPEEDEAAAAAVRHLQNLYDGSVRKRQLVRQLVQRLEDLEGDARAEGTRPYRKDIRDAISSIVKEITGFKNIKKDVAVAMEGWGIGVAAPAPPAVLGEDPEVWVPASVRRLLRRRSS